MEIHPYLKIQMRPDVNILGIYIEGYHFEHFDKWWETECGEILVKLLSKDRYKGHLKCVYFDNSICTNEQIHPSVRKNLLECIMNWTYVLNESENIKCFTNCDSCLRFCTIKFYFDHVPKCMTKEKYCQQCY